jgi:hypothetical protein
LREEVFFCRLEPFEIPIWPNGAPASEGVGIKIPADSGWFRRTCGKMATATGKIIVMGMTIARHVLNQARWSYCKGRVDEGSGSSTK